MPAVLTPIALPHLTEAERAAVLDIAAFIQRQCGDDLLMLRLFGSKARGDVHGDSDIDLLAVVEDAADALRERCVEYVVDVGLQCEQEIDLLWYSRARYAESAQQGGALIRDVLKEGLPLVPEKADRLPTWQENRVALANVRWENAQETLAKARYVLNGGFWKGPVSAAYYAMFHGARALLATEGRDSHRHPGVGALFSECFVRPGSVPDQLGSVLGKALELRFDADYRDEAAITEQQAREAVAQAEQFLHTLAPLLQERLQALEREAQSHAD